MRQTVITTGFRQCKIADGDHMRAGIGRLRVTATVSEGVELLGIAEFKPSLIADPRPQPAFKCAVFARIKRSERQNVCCA